MIILSTRTILGESVRMAARPLLVLRKTIVQEDLKEREELVALRGNNSVNVEEGIEVEEVGEAEGGRDGIDGCALSFG